ncbi:hypothetical protein [Acidithiobacillus sulfurivorans]|uniref:hypothetical protein n=1 Tax=Acidithiobacillus sulfurivorans TaxID=1958756 RepID=UPI001D00C10F|nr:hypothetical protein [Acidithiobacillus sulfurivorans]
MHPNIAEFPHPERIGTFREFGPFGIPYQILREGHDTAKGWSVEIEVPHKQGNAGISAEGRS